MTLFADNFLAGAVLTLLLPTLLLIAVAAFLHWAVTRVPADTPVTATSLPDRETVAAAEAEGNLLESPRPSQPDSTPRQPGATPHQPGSTQRDAEPPVTAS